MVVVPSDDDEPVKIGTITSLTDREFKVDFASPGAILDDGLSLERRPDSISFDYLTAFSLGPIQLGDFSAGPINRAWKVRASGTNVFSARQNDTGDGFEDEEIVFTFAGVGATEIDAAFDQSAHILVCMERPTGAAGASEVWIYYFDPFVADYVLTNFGRGRTPRAVLDDILDSSNADILVFYLADDTGMCWRQQRERYLVERVVNQVQPTIPDTGLMVLQGPVTWSYDYPPQVGVPGEAGFAGYPEHATDPITYVGAAMDAFTPYPLNTGIGISSSTGTLRIIEETGGKPVGYPGTAFSGTLEDTFNQDYGLWVSRRDHGALIRFSTRVYYAEIEAFMSFFGGARMQALNDDFSVVAEYTFAKNTDAVTREQGIVYHQLGFTMIQLIPSAGDSTHWSNFKFSETQIPGPLTPAVLDLPNTYLEDVYKATSGRVVIIYSVHDPILGRYTIGTLATVLYPQVMDRDDWQIKHTTPTVGTNSVAIFYIGPYPDYLTPLGTAPPAFDDIDNWKIIDTIPLSGDLISIVIFHTLFDMDNWQIKDTEPLSGQLFVVLLFHTLFDMDEWQIKDTEPLSGTLVLVLILHTLFDTDDWKINDTVPLSGTLAP